MGIALELKREQKVKLIKASKSVKLGHVIENLDWLDVLVNDKFVQAGKYDVKKNTVTFSNELVKGSVVKVREFIKVGKTRSRKK